MKNVYLFVLALMAATAGHTQTFPNAGMENWRSGYSGTTHRKAVTAPTSWFGFDSLIIADGELYGFLLGAGSNWNAQLFEENTVIHSGSAAAKLITMKQDTLGFFAGVLSNASVSIDIAAVISGAGLASAYTFSGGTAVAARIDSVSAWVQYMSGKDSTGATGRDAGLLNVQAISYVGGRDSVVGAGVARITSTGGVYQLVSARVVYTDTVDAADTIRITFASSGGGLTAPLDSSTLYVDDVSMVAVPGTSRVAVKNIIAGNGIVKVYPNPASTALFIAGAQNQELTARLYTIDGRQVINTAFTGNGSVDITGLQPGLYFYSVSDAAGQVAQSGQVAVSR